MKSRVKKRVIALMLCMVMVLSSGISTLAEGDAGTPEATEEISSTNDESAVNTEPDTAVAEESQSRSNTDVETETAAEENAPAEAEAQPKTAEAAPAENTETDAAAQAPVEETQTEETKDNAADAQSTEQSAENGEAVQEETTTPETENETAQNTETAPQPYEEKYEDDTIKITVNAEAGIVPEGAELSVTPIEKTEITDDMTAEEKAEAEKINDQYELTEKKLNEDSEENEETMEGFLAYDISFLVNGEEVEPSGDVNVVMEFQEAAIPEGVSEDAAVTVKHLKEDETAEDGVVVEDMADKAEVQTTDKAEVEKVELTADSFSTFTITWNTNGYGDDEFTITAHYVYLSGNSWTEFEDNVVSSEDIEWEDRGDTIQLSSYQKEVLGYEYQSTRVNNAIYGTEITALKRIASGTNNNNGDTVQYLREGQETYTTWLRENSYYYGTTGDIYFVYAQNTPGEVVIQNNIVNDGDFKAVYTPTGNNETVVSYTWSRSESGAEGTWTEVARINYQDGNSNLSEDESSLYPAWDSTNNEDTGARKWYQVEVTLSDGSTKTSEPMQVPYYDALQNGSFEDVDIRGTIASAGESYKNDNNWQYSNEEYADANGVWQSTAEITKSGYYWTGKKRAIEIVREGLGTDNGGGYSWYNGQNVTNKWENATSYGSQFAELNCEAAGALYQDVLTIEGTSMNYWLAHRARGKLQDNTKEYDTMYLVIMPTSIALENDLTTQDTLEKYLSSLPGADINFNDNGNSVGHREVYRDVDSGILVVRVTSNDQNWNYFSEEYDYTPTSSLTRFFFVAGGTATEDKTRGNFLDNVGFSQDLPDVQDDQFSLELVKEFAGLDDEHLQEIKDKIQFKVSATRNGEELRTEELESLLGEGSSVIEGSEMREGRNGTLSYTWANRTIQPGNSYTFTMTEINTDLDDYSLDTQFASSVEEDGEQQSSMETSSVTLTGNQIGYITIKNTYTPTSTKAVNFTKVWDDADNYYDTRPESIEIELTASIMVNGQKIDLAPADDLGIENVNITIEPEHPLVDDEWKYSWENVPVYFVYDGVSYPVEYSVTEESIGGDYVYNAVNEGIAQEGDSSAYEPQVESPEASEDSSMNAIALTSNALSANRNSANTQLGAPAHKKYISSYDAEKDEYTLNLDVKGAKGEASGGADILFVIDKSASMDASHNNLMNTLKELLIGEKKWGSTDDTGIIDKIFETEGNNNSVAFVAFSNMDRTEVSAWYDSSEKSKAEDFVDELYPYEGTNWTWAMVEASNLLKQKANSNNEKVVIFLSDGLPTYTADKWHDGSYYEDGNGYEDDAEYYYRTDAAKIVNNSDTLKNATFYSVYLTQGTYLGMKTFDDNLRIVNHDLINGIDLKKALEDIMHLVIPEYKNVSITDTLSEYADFVSADEESVTVTKTSASGNSEKLNPSEYDVNFDGKKVTVTLLGGKALEDGATYTISFNIKPSDYAKSEYAEKGYLVDGTTYQGDGGTGDTSAGKDGFYSNNYAQTYVEYTITGEPSSDTANYPRPVIQVQAPKVTATSIEVHKVWVGGIGTDSVEVALYQSKDGGEPTKYGDALTLDATNNWTGKWTDLPDTEGTSKYEYEVREVSVPENYSCTVSYADGAEGQCDTIATVTNTYDENTKDVNLYIANVLQLDDLNVVKQWEGDAGHTNLRPDSLTVNISNDFNDKTYSIELTGDTWSGSIKVPRLKKGTYSASEVNLNSSYEQTHSDYVADTNTFTFTNSLKTTSLTVNKVWNDGNLKTTHDAVNFVLQYREKGNTDESGWQPYSSDTTYTLNAANKWTTTINNLPIYNDYKVVEVGTPGGYISNVSPNEDGVITITNTLKWSAVKVHKSGDDTKYLDGATFELHKGGELLATGESNTNGEITWTIAEDKEIDIQHMEDGTYTITEIKAPAGYVIDADGWTVEFKNGVLIRFDGNDVSGTIDDGVVIQLDNEMLYVLPEAGGPGIYWYMLGGVLLMMAGSLLVYKKRRGEVLRRK